MSLSPSITFVILGLALLAGGLGYRIPRWAEWDARVFRSINGALNERPLTDLFRLAWPLGTTTFTLLALLLVAFVNFHAALPAAAIYLGAVTLERLIKAALLRPRPFEALPGIAVLQPRRPLDPSFPSGDALRVWFLTIMLSAAFVPALPYILLGGLLACLVSLGRIALGVHYPLDVVAGAGLGALAAGISLAFR